MSSIQPPERASTAGSLMVVVVLCFFTLVLYLPGARIWLVAAIVLLTATAVRLRQAPAIHSGLLVLLIIIGFMTPAIRATWPFSGLLVVGVYAGVVRRTTLLKTSSGWARKGRPTCTDLVLSVILGGLTFLAIMMWVRLARPDLSGQIAAIPDASIWKLVVIGVLFAVVNSFIEEVIFRGVFMYSLEAALGTWAAVVLQAIIFGLFHVQGLPSGPYGMLLAGVVGLVLGFLRLRTRGMLAPWITHGTANGLIYLYLALQ